MTREEISNLILSRKNDIDETRLKYFTDYFYVLANDKDVIGKCDLVSLIDNALVYATNIIFYDENDDMFKKLGPDCKGYRDEKNHIIYVRKDLDEVLKEITVYHELHHAVQTNPLNDEVGINQYSNLGRLIMEAQTQYYAEKIYQQIHGVKFEEREIPSENLRMQEGGVVVSALHNYEMYDSLISKMAIIMEVPKEFFVHINYLYKDDEGLKLLETKYEEARMKYKIPYTFNQYMFKLDYIYCVDLLGYVENKDKEVVLSGKETENAYAIYPNVQERVSLKRQFNHLNNLDRQAFIGLLEENGNYKEFAKYIFSKDTKELAFEIMGSSLGAPSGGGRK